MVENLKLNKKSLQYLGIILIIAIIVCIGLFYYRSLIPELEIKEEALEELKQKKIIGQQLEELDELRGEDAEPLTEEEIEKQSEELDKLR